MSASKESLWSSGVALALVPAVLYCVSTAYYGGFMGVLRLDADVLDRNFHQTLYHGFLTAFVPAFYVLGALCALLWLYSHLVLPELNDRLRGNWKKQRKFLKAKQWMLGKRRDSLFERRQKQRSVRVFFLLLAGGVFITFLARFERVGKQDAVKLMVHLEGPARDEGLVTVQIEGQTRRLFYLHCGARNCAAIDPETRMVHYFPQNGHAFKYVGPAPSLAVKSR